VTLFNSIRLSEKCDFTSSATVPIIKQQKSASTEGKLGIIIGLGNGEHIANICWCLGQAESTARSDGDNAEQIKGNKVDSLRFLSEEA
jgi:hypothetical protein